MNKELQSMLNRAKELLKELEDEYRASLLSRSVTDRARNLTHEVVERLRAVLDHTMRLAWEKFIAPSLTSKDRGRARVYYPITNDMNSFRSTLGRGCMADLEMTNAHLYDFLLKRQPFFSNENQWLSHLSDIAGIGKHVQLIPQKRRDSKRITVEGHGGSVSWDPSSVRFEGGVSIVGAPVDPTTQRIVPTPGVTEKLEVWVSFILEGHGIDALGFCKEAYNNTNALVEEIVSEFEI